MKKTIYTLLVLLTGLNLTAQKNYMGLSMGGSFPLGTYANEAGVNTTGYALTGFTLSFNGNYYFIDHIGFHGAINYGMNSVDEEKLKTDWVAHLKALYPDADLPDDAVIDFTTLGWLYVNALSGPVLGLSISKFTIEARATAGLSYIRPPERNIRITFRNTEITSFASGQSMAFGYQLGTGILFTPNNVTGIRLAFDYFSSTAKIDLESHIDEGLGNPVISTETVKFPISTIHLTLGLAYLF